MVYQSDESGAAEVWAQPVPPTGAKFQISTAGGQQPRWRRDGKELYYLSPAGQVMAVPVTAGKSLERGAPKELFGGMQFPRRLEARGFAYQPSADGQRFLFSLPAGKDATPPPLTVVVNWLTEWNKK
ncbi:MAG: hypothetical protein FJW30_28105 [Acidobacteria bacterium]|nr:hypothetical protein [Acidobacteriota bacterium]